MSPPLPSRVLRPDFLFLDMEASSLEGGFPIEIGVCDDALQAHSWLIQPHPSWQDLEWNDVSQQIHGISQAKLIADGLPVDAVLLEMSKIVSPGHAMHSDNPTYDARWLQQLCCAGRRWVTQEINPFLQASFDVLEGNQWADVIEHRLERSQELARLYWPHIHRAGPDAKSMAAVFRMLVDEDYFEEVERYDREMKGKPSAIGLRA
ncbi:3'-5' exonuclease [Bosea sp. RAC05]|uniref:3'-5' exonuclease n=1 Tax=Bosea sp. RAC05 TaxID=1842539 RepID=UPI00083CDCC2|nr:hypothetical protein [Bosea sp. RAC05]AOG02958.1 hypothetical protein BSY19_5110 [Bosea sp. RAC05]